ncbi:hypothetical protein I4F81_012638 [Pyropia yezoensis]|uniref:Uncharacterized protein n=1 Tax=Pyropia yezoensis TaxID=2788 RepID=A0ACC3CJN2_PYRYE|nr:hypothetical protein I4F81_012638 [Neopyropia yezoensis]
MRRRRRHHRHRRRCCRRRCRRRCRPSRCHLLTPVRSLPGRGCRCRRCHRRYRRRPCLRPPPAEVRPRGAPHAAAAAVAAAAAPARRLAPPAARRPPPAWRGGRQWRARAHGAARRPAGDRRRRGRRAEAAAARGGWGGGGGGRGRRGSRPAVRGALDLPRLPAASSPLAGHPRTRCCRRRWRGAPPARHRVAGGGRRGRPAARARRSLCRGWRWAWVGAWGERGRGGVRWVAAAPRRGGSWARRGCTACRRGRAADDGRAAVCTVHACWWTPYYTRTEVICRQWLDEGHPEPPPRVRAAMAVEPSPRAVEDYGGCTGRVMSQAACAPSPTHARLHGTEGRFLLDPRGCRL